jgi:hypothetical protein
MTLSFPSPEFDEIVAAVCHGVAAETQSSALNGLLRDNLAARDEYLFRVEVHTRLASDPDLFSRVPDEPQERRRLVINFQETPNLAVGRPTTRARVMAWAACLVVAVAGVLAWRMGRQNSGRGATSAAVAMLARVVDARWSQGDGLVKEGGALEPGWLRLESGLAQVVFYSGARVVIEGPATLQIISPGEASCANGKLVAEVPPQARGFRVRTPQMSVTDLGTAFGLEVKDRQTELHVFKGRVEFQPADGAEKKSLKEGAGAVTENARPLQLITANPAAFASLFDLQPRASAAEVLRDEQWRAASGRLDEDPSLLVHFDFEPPDPSDWRLRNASKRRDDPSDATIIGCQWVEGRWPGKRALEFRGESDRARLSVPGEFESLTLAAWVRVQGLDRQFNSLFMCDRFEPGTLHWLIRNDGVLGLTAIGSGPGQYQIVASSPALTLEEFGTWLHLAVVLDGNRSRVTQYVNGQLVGGKALKVGPPFRVGAAELGNWNSSGFRDNDPALIRNFSGAMDEFCLFSRALSAEEIRALYSAGKPQPDAFGARR